MMTAAVFGAGLAAGAALTAYWLGRRSRLRARYLSFIAHEINTPITALHMTALNFLQGTFGPVSKEHEPWLNIIRMDVSRLGNLVGDLRDYIHMDWHRDLEIEFAAFDLAEVVRAILEEARPGLERVQIGFELHIESELPAASGDGNRIGRVIAGILAHGKKFRSAGALKLFCGKGEAGRLQVALEFLGTPLDQAVSANILDLYFPAQPTGSHVLTCVGLGLGFPRRMVEAHGGRMQFSVDEKGLTRVAFQIPVHEDVP